MPLDEAAFAALHAGIERPLWAYVYRTTGNAADAEDIVAEAFCRFIQSAQTFPDDEGARRYMFRIAGNLIADRWRRASRDQKLHVRIQSEPAAAPAEEFSDQQAVARMFGRLKPRERALLWLAYVEEHDHGEIARALGLSHRSVKVLLSRARARLRDLLAATGIIARTG